MTLGNKPPFRADHVGSLLRPKAPLRFLPKGKSVVLGIMTSKFSELESADALKLRIDESAKFAPLDRPAVGARCGFLSAVEGNELTVDD